MARESEGNIVEAGKVYDVIDSDNEYYYMLSCNGRLHYYKKTLFYDEPMERTGEGDNVKAVIEIDKHVVEELIKNILLKKIEEERAAYLDGKNTNDALEEEWELFEDEEV